MVTDPVDNSCYLAEILHQKAACRESLAAFDLHFLHRGSKSGTGSSRNQTTQNRKAGDNPKRLIRLPESVDIVQLIHDARLRFGKMSPFAPQNPGVDQTGSSVHPSALEVFVEGVAHHFNNTFMAIQGYVSLLLHGIDPLHPDIACLQRIEKLVHGESILTNDLLQFLIGRPSRISDRDQMRLLREIGNVASFVETATGKQLAIQGKYAASNPPEQVLRSLSGSIACVLGRLLTEIHEQALQFEPQVETSAAALERLQKIKDLSRQGLRPVCQLLAYAGVTALPNGHRVGRGSLIDAVQETFVFKEESIRLFMDVDADLPKMKLQRRQLVEILMAVVDNAAEAMSQGGDLFFKAVKLRPEEIDEPGWHVPARHFIRLTVRDSGRGFDPRFGRLIFDPFFTSKGRGGHCGLGLSSIYGMVHTLGGYIGVDSEPGCGSAFHIYLPAEKASMPAAGTPDWPASRASGKQVIDLGGRRRRHTGLTRASEDA